MPAKRATTTTAVETVDQSETEIERRRPEFPGQNVVLKTIAGGRTLLLNAKPARKSVKKLLPYFYRASLQEPRAVLYVRQQKAESVPARRAATTTAVEIEQSTKLKTNESPNSRVATPCLKQLVNAKPTRKLVKELLPYFYRARLQDQDARSSAEGRKRACQARRDHESGRDRTVEPEQSLRSKLHEQRMARSSSTSADRVFQFHTASRAAFMGSELRVVQKKNRQELGARVPMYRKNIDLRLA